MIDVYCDSSIKISCYIFVIGDYECYFRYQHNYKDSNQSEFIGVLSSLRKLSQCDIPEKTKINLYCDSQSAIYFFNLIFGGGSKSTGEFKLFKKIYNDNMSKKTIDILKKLDISLHHVYGHSGLVYNEMCDRMCNNNKRSTVNKNGFEFTVCNIDINRPIDYWKIRKNLKTSFMFKVQNYFSYMYKNNLPIMGCKNIINEKIVRKLAYRNYLEDPSRSADENWRLAEEFYKKQL